MKRAKAAGVCCCCGQVLPPSNPFLPSRPVKARIYDFVSRHPEGVTRDQIADFAYADDPEGGADSRTVTVHIKVMNDATLKPMGCKIVSTRGHGAIYRLVVAST